MRISDWSSDVCSSDLEICMRARRSFSRLAALLRRAIASAMPRCRATPDTENPQRLHHGISDSRHWPSLHEFAAADAAVVVELRKVAAVVEPELARRDVRSEGGRVGKGVCQSVR